MNHSEIMKRFECDPERRWRKAIANLGYDLLLLETNAVTQHTLVLWYVGKAARELMFIEARNRPEWKTRYYEDVTAIRSSHPIDLDSLSVYTGRLIAIVKNMAS